MANTSAFRVANLSISVCCKWRPAYRATLRLHFAVRARDSLWSKHCHLCRYALICRRHPS